MRDRHVHHAPGGSHRRCGARPRGAGAGRERPGQGARLPCADVLNVNGTDLVCLQHEFGIFGGMAGSHLLLLRRPLIETPGGWLVIYHGVRRTASGSIYRLGLALLDLEHPEVPLMRGDAWVMRPETPYDQQGDVPNVVFPCGVTVGDDGDTLAIYYGAANTSIGPAHASIHELLAWLDQNAVDDPDADTMGPER